MYLPLHGLVATVPTFKRRCSQGCGQELLWDGDDECLLRLVDGAVLPYDAIAAWLQVPNVSCGNASEEGVRARLRARAGETEKGTETDWRR